MVLPRVANKSSGGAGCAEVGDGHAPLFVVPIHHPCLLLAWFLLLQDRIRAAGGRIVFNGGARRVNGMLAMTRSIGDHYLRPYVIAEPEVRGRCVQSRP